MSEIWPHRRAVLLMGPTGAGKTALAMQLKQHLPIEIVSVDSALVYRGMDIGTAKPDLQMRCSVAHHLIDIRDPEANYSAGEFVLDANALMHDIWQRGRLPVFVGGTMLYYHALSMGIADLPEADLAIRAEIDAQAARVGWATLHRELAMVDPDAAAHIHHNDSQRVQRALEVFRITGRRISTLQKARFSPLANVRVLEIAVAPRERTDLHARIETRFRAMLEAGLVSEVSRLRQRNGLTAAHPSMRAVGYRQIWRYLGDECLLDCAVDEALAATRQLAKRQFTWLRARKRLKWVDSAQPDAISFVLTELAAHGIAGGLVHAV